MVEKTRTTFQIDDFVVSDEQQCLDALSAIEHNQRGFVIVENKLGKVIGTLTDGDIRRALIAGVALSGRICDSRPYRSNFTSVQSGVCIDELIEAFKNPSIDFLPILGEEDNLAGIVTRKQLYVLILQCRDLPSFAELLNVDESLMDFEIFKRPWGIYKTTVLQNKYQAKILQIRPDAQLSLQYHRFREEYWVVASGEGIAQIGDSSVTVRSGSVVFVPRGCKHRMSNTSSTEQLIIAEVQIGEYFGEDDIIRLEDKYGRLITKGDADHA